MPNYVTVNNGLRQDQIEILDENFDSRSAAIREAIDEFLDERNLLQDEDGSGLDQLIDSNKD